MTLRLFQVDAFAERVFEGNPAAVVPLEQWLDDATLQAIAEENQLSETAFFAAVADGYRLRWFTPVSEVDLCGHATLACAHVLFHHLGFDQDVVRFQTRSGELSVRRTDTGLAMDFPALASEPVAVPGDLIDGFSGCKPEAVFRGQDYLALLPGPGDVLGLEPDFTALARLDRRGVIATAPGEDCDFVSRCFYPKLGVAEDPVTGSAHCQLAPFWAARLGRTELSARQVSTRTGRLRCRVVGERVELLGSAVTYLEGELSRGAAEYGGSGP